MMHLESFDERQKRARSLLAVLLQTRPNPQMELVAQGPFQILVAVMLSAQSTDKGVNHVTPQLFKEAPNPQAMLALGQARVETLIQSLGLFRAKARHLIAMSQCLLESHQGQVPKTREALMRLPGVGRKTANVVLHAAFGQATLAVDTHILRVARRLGLSTQQHPDKVEHDITALLTEEELRHAHHSLILHGRYTCKARRPLCPECPIRTLCPTFSRGEYS